MSTAFAIKARQLLEVGGFSEQICWQGYIPSVRYDCAEASAHLFVSQTLLLYGTQWGQGGGAEHWALQLLLPHN